MSNTVWFLEWTDDPLGLAGTGRKVGTVGTLADAKELVLDRYPHARFEGPFYVNATTSKMYARSGSGGVAILREFPEEYSETKHSQELASLVDRHRRGEITRAEYSAEVVRHARKDPA